MGAHELTACRIQHHDNHEDQITSNPPSSHAAVQVEDMLPKHEVQQVEHGWYDIDDDLMSPAWLALIYQYIADQDAYIDIRRPGPFPFVHRRPPTSQGLFGQLSAEIINEICALCFNEDKQWVGREPNDKLPQLRIGFISPILRLNSHWRTLQEQHYFHGLMYCALLPQRYAGAMGYSSVSNADAIRGWAILEEKHKKLVRGLILYAPDHTYSLLRSGLFMLDTAHIHQPHQQGGPKPPRPLRMKVTVPRVDSYFSYHLSLLAEQCCTSCRINSDQRPQMRHELNAWNHGNQRLTTTWQLYHERFSSESPFENNELFGPCEEPELSWMLFVVSTTDMPMFNGRRIRHVC